MKKVMIAAVMLTTLFFVSCKKEKTTTELNTFQKIAGKWGLKKYATNELTGTQQYKDTGYYQPGEYMQFDADGQFTIRVDNEVTVSAWQLINNDGTIYILPAGALDLSDDGYDIKSVTDNSLVLNASVSAGNDFYEVTIYLER